MDAAKPLYRVVDWDTHFETYESKRLARGCSWVAMPNKHDGRSFRRLMLQKDGVALYGAWVLIVEVASKMPVRGILADLNGPLDPEDLAFKTGAAQKTIERALAIISSERIGWLERIEPAGVSAILREIDTVARARRARTRTSPASVAGVPADFAEHPHVPADSSHLPAACGQNGERPQVPADSRRPAGDSAPRARALAYRTVPDSTGPDTHTASVGALESTSELILSFFGKKGTGRRLSQQAQHALAEQAGALPLSAEQERLLGWWMGLPNDEADPWLRSRPGDANKLAIRLFDELDRAAAHAKKTGAPVGVGVRTGQIPAWPAGTREWLVAHYPEAALRCDTWAGVPESVQSEFQLSSTSALNRPTAPAKTNTP